MKAQSFRSFRIWGKPSETNHFEVVILKQDYKESLILVRELKSQGWTFQGRVAKNI